MIHSPVVGIIHDAAGTVCPYLIKIDALFDGRAAVDHVVIGIQRNVHRLDAFVVLNGSFKRKIQCSQKRT